MKLKIKKYVNNNKMSKAFGKTYGRIQHQQTLTTLELAKHIQKHGSIFTRDVIVGVLEKFSLCIEELLQEGYKVKLDGLGTFYLSAKTTGEENSKDFGIANISSVRIRFVADRSKDYDWNTQAQTSRSTFTFGEKESGSASDSGTTNGNEEEAGEDRP